MSRRQPAFLAALIAFSAARDVHPAKGVGRSRGVGDSGRVNHGVATCCCDRQAVRVGQVADDSFDILERSRIAALADVRHDLVAGRLQIARDGAADESGCPCNQTAHARLVTGSDRFTNRYAAFGDALAGAWSCVTRISRSLLSFSIASRAFSRPCPMFFPPKR